MQAVRRCDLYPVQPTRVMALRLVLIYYLIWGQLLGLIKRGWVTLPLGRPRYISLSSGKWAYLAYWMDGTGHPAVFSSYCGLVYRYKDG